MRWRWAVPFGWTTRISTPTRVKQMARSRYPKIARGTMASVSPGGRYQRFRPRVEPGLRSAGRPGTRWYQRLTAGHQATRPSPAGQAETLAPGVNEAKR